MTLPHHRHCNDEDAEKINKQDGNRTLKHPLAEALRDKNNLFQKR